MTYNEIAEFVEIKHPITYSNSKTEVKLKNNQSLWGYFDCQTEELKLKNQWNFIVIPQENNLKNTTIISGDEIISIHLHLIGR